MENKCKLTPIDKQLNLTASDLDATALKSFITVNNRKVSVSLQQKGWQLGCHRFWC